MKAVFGHQREQLVSMNSIEPELPGHFEKVYILVVEFKEMSLVIPITVGMHVEF